MTLSLRDVNQVNTAKVHTEDHDDLHLTSTIAGGVKSWILILCKTYNSNWGEKCISSWKPHSKCPWNTEKMVGEEYLDESQEGDLDCVQGWT